MRCRLLLVICLLSLAFNAAYGITIPLSEQATVSMLTCTPGKELYSRYGHTAVRVSDPDSQLDVVFNYGIFSFETDHFYWRFVKGETYYKLGVENYSDFMLHYAFMEREVYEQVLNLDSAQKQAYFDALVINSLPENAEYLYNFVYDNCATRPYLLLCQVLGDSIVSAYQGYTGQSYRRFISHYTGHGSWADLGINLIFGSMANQSMPSSARLFLPEELMLYLSRATLPDGQPLVLEENIRPFPIYHTPWYATWYFGLGLLAVVMAVVSLIDRHRKKLSWWVDMIVGIVYCLLLVIVVFLTFFSIHPLVGFGWRLFIIPAIHLCARLIYIVR